MKVKVLKDTTLEVKAGQTVEIPDWQFALCSDRVEIVEEKKKPVKKK